jgi:N-methylhydantoinase A
MRFAVDTGGTFTDLIVEDDAGALHMFKASTVPSQPIRGVLDALEVAAKAFEIPLRALLARGSTFIYGTTHAINAIITGRTARTAFLTTEGHPDILVLREGGRMEPFNYGVPHPDPYIPRRLTWEIPGRIIADGSELIPLGEAEVIRIAAEMHEAGVEAIAVCLLWSIVNPAHEQRVGQLLDQRLPGVPYTLSHRLNPTFREYRRASSACIDASLKPMMTPYMETLGAELREAGFPGRVLVVTSQGGVLDGTHVAQHPIHLINSGPSMAPVAGRRFAAIDEGADTAIIADTGGTTYDVSLVRRGHVPWTRETWIGQPFRGHMTGFPSVDVKSIGAGGGSIAWVDDGGLLNVGPQSAGATPGPACYGRGGDRPTMTDAAVALGYVDPDFFLGGSMRLEVEAARSAIATHVGNPLRMSVDEAATAIVAIATENMVQAILDITVNQGIDPRDAVLVGGGGAAGLNSVLIARRLGARRLLIPEIGSALSAAGAMMSDLTAYAHATLFTTTADFDYARVNAMLDAFEAQALDFVRGPGADAEGHKIRFSAEARYPDQVWEIEVPLPNRHFAGPADVRALVEAFHDEHQAVFATKDPGSGIEIVSWNMRVACPIRGDAGGMLKTRPTSGDLDGTRSAYFPEQGRAPARIRRFEAMRVGEVVAGPAIIESSFTSVVLNPGATAERRASGSLSIHPGES